MEAYASNAAIRRLKQEDCFGFKVSLRCIVKIQANLDCRMRPCPLKRPRTSPQSYSLKSSHVTQGPLLLPEGAAFFVKFPQVRVGGGAQKELTQLSQLSDTLAVRELERRPKPSCLGPRAERELETACHPPPKKKNQVQKV